MGRSLERNYSSSSSSSGEELPDIPQQLIHGPEVGFAQQPPNHRRLAHLQQDSYSESGSSSLRSSPYSSLGDVPLDPTLSHHGLHILASSATNTPLPPHLWTPYLDQNVYGASNVPVWGNSYALSNPINIPPRLNFGTRFHDPSMGYGAASSIPNRAQTNLSTNFPSTHQTSSVPHTYNQRDYLDQGLHQNQTTNGEASDVNVQTQGVEDVEEEDLPLVVDESYSSSEDENDAETQRAVPTVVDSDDGAPPTKMWRIEPSMNSFWQYKKQVKGPTPKSYNMSSRTTSSNPHEPTRYVDPAFDRDNPVDISHFGKARIGEGNDIRPNPSKLKDLGEEIDELAEKMTKTVDSRAKRTQISSKISRLKKVANHEANKIKFDGLETEREELSAVIRAGTKAVKSRVSVDKSMTQHIDDLKQKTLKTNVAGRTGAYVDSILDKSKS